MDKLAENSDKWRWIEQEAELAAEAAIDGIDPYGVCDG